MPKLYFRYGTMNSSKTANLIMVAYNYISQQKNTIILKPSIDKRFHNTKITSRVGISIDTDYLIYKNSCINDILKKINKKDVRCILVDEGQFLEKKHVDQLKDITKKIPVIVYGLKTDFKSNLFEGSARLLEIADSIEEIKTICSNVNCDKKAIINAKFIVNEEGNREIIYSGEQIDLGCEEKYCALCYNCWKK